MNIVILKNGPILIDGPAKFKVEGSAEFTDIQGDKVALCRCDNSTNKPFCDGGHKSCHFSGPQSEIVTG